MFVNCPKNACWEIQSANLCPVQHLFSWSISLYFPSSNCSHLPVRFAINCVCEPMDFNFPWVSATVPLNITSVQIQAVLSFQIQSGDLQTVARYGFVRPSRDQSVKPHSCLLCLSTYRINAVNHNIYDKSFHKTHEVVNCHQSKMKWRNPFSSSFPPPALPPHVDYCHFLKM